METLTNKGVSCFLHRPKSKYRRYYVKKDTNVCWRCTNKACKARIEIRDGTVEEFGFHCHVETIVNASATVLRTACKRKALEHVMERQLLPMELNPNAEFNAPHPNIYIIICRGFFLRQQAATYVTVSSLSKSRTIPRLIREKSARLREPFTDYSAGLQSPD